MTQHPQVEAFVSAAESMRGNRYWARDPQEQIEFLTALRNVLAEVCFHLDRNQLLNQEGLRAFAASSGAPHGLPWLEPSAETVLLPELDNAIQRCLAGLEGADNT
ncbi:hypothetical protein [Arthrobacter glacialis]|uniref:Uncharacterized protein n=1 Tax=Arthrobacter glacialis TaxID=1664 RepID=A0A2S3ZVA9_ARTGL|nr:hypothetical protein [Arthrobacter glacialis]POH57486.1 hypothetical protein CVS28_15780 [Arthrobacter glacialis]POH73191.1 hypothetical protein CVS27_11765 [Arthrobacter glacialis]